MTGYKRVIHTATGRALVSRALWCDSFLSKLRGFTWRRALAPGEGLVLVQPNDSRINSAIHMLFVFFSLGVVWVNEAGIVVDVALARPWRLHYAPRAPARYVVETHPDVLSHVDIGDVIHFD